MATPPKEGQSTERSRRAANALSEAAAEPKGSPPRFDPDIRLSMDMSPWYVYILRCIDDSLYVGISNDVERRVQRHNDGHGAAYTRSRRPVVLIWKEVKDSESAARQREAQIKGWTRIKKLNLISYGHPNGPEK